MLENREVTKHIFPDMLANSNVRMVSSYPLLLHQSLLSLAPQQISNPTAVILTPGIYNSAYYEHTFLARQMGIPLVEEDPRNFITQPIIKLLIVPRFIDGKFVARHVYLRPYALCEPSEIQIVPGGLTRVALKEGSLVVNSSHILNNNLYNFN